MGMIVKLFPNFSIEINTFDPIQFILYIFFICVPFHFCYFNKLKKKSSIAAVYTVIIYEMVFKVLSS